MKGKQVNSTDKSHHAKRLHAKRSGLVLETQKSCNYGRWDLGLEKGVIWHWLLACILRSWVMGHSKQEFDVSRFSYHPLCQHLSGRTRQQKSILTSDAQRQWVGGLMLRALESDAGHEIRLSSAVNLSSEESKSQAQSPSNARLDCPAGLKRRHLVRVHVGLCHAFWKFPPHCQSQKEDKLWNSEQFNKSASPTQNNSRVPREK